MPLAAAGPVLEARFLRLLRAGTPVGLAVSGGSDSMALLHLAAATGGMIRVASVDHGLRPAAAAECAQVAQACAALALPHTTLRWTGWDGRGNLQDQARRARYRLLAAWAQAAGIADVALGHTADDQAETVLMALARGAGVAGLAGMGAISEKHGCRFHRPLLDQARADLRAWLAGRGLGWCEDPSNADPRYERIRLRQAAPLLADLGLTPVALGQVARQMAQAAMALQVQTDHLARGCLMAQGGDVVLTVPLADLSQEQARRLLLAGMAQVNRALAPPRRAEQLRLLAVLRRGGGGTLGGCVLSPEGPVLRISREMAAVADHITATTALWDGRWRLDGPHDAALAVAALGQGIDLCPDRRDSPLPRLSLMASPAIWCKDRLVAAPLAGYGTGWRARIVAE